MKTHTFGMTINKTPTRIYKNVNDIEQARGKAVKYDKENGGVVLCETADETFLGLVIYEGTDPLKAGNDVTVQIKDIGIGIAGGEITIGDYVSATTDGKLVKCESGFAAGQAMSNAVENQTFYVQITKSGVVK